MAATVPELLRAVYGQDQVRYLLALVAANVALGVVAAVRAGDFRLVLVADWLTKRMLPLLVGYGSAALLAWSNPDLALVRDAAWASLSLALLGYVLSNLRDLGVPLPEALTRPTPETLAASQPPQPVVIVPPSAARDDDRKV